MPPVTKERTKMSMKKQFTGSMDIQYTILDDIMPAAPPCRDGGPLDDITDADAPPAGLLTDAAPAPGPPPGPPDDAPKFDPTVRTPALSSSSSPFCSSCKKNAVG